MARKTEVDFLRWASGSVLVAYYVMRLPQLTFLYGAQGMIDRRLIESFAPSILFQGTSDWFLFLLYAAMLMLAVLFTFGHLGRLGTAALFMCHLSFSNANPLIIHEPQQIMTLVLFSFVFFLSPRARDEQDAWLVKTAVFALAFYYLVVGLKKLPDPGWLDGTAVGSLAQWNGIARGGWFDQQLASSRIFSSFATWSGLLLEISYFPLVFTRFRPWILVAVLFFHLGIAWAFDLGNISAAMIAWNAIMLDENTRATYSRWFNKLRISGESRNRQT